MQLTWMDAKVDGWVVTPRRGKPVEINALWHNALVLLASWMVRAGRGVLAEDVAREAHRCRESFNRAVLERLTAAPLRRRRWRARG